MIGLRLRWLLVGAALLAAVAAQAQTVSVSPPSAGQYPGTSTNNSANAGNIGEISQASLAAGSAISPSSGVATDVISTALTAGQWQCSGHVALLPQTGTTATNVLVGINTTSATIRSAAQPGVAQMPYTFTAAASQNLVAAVDPVPFQLSGAGTAYLTVNATFSGGTMQAYGVIYCVRTR